MRFIIGIDEAGRGPLAGPVTVGAFLVRLENGNQKEHAEESRQIKKVEKWILKNIFENKLRDSKKLSPEKREKFYKIFCILKKNPTLLGLRGTSKIDFAVAHSTPKVIDKIGISKAVFRCIAKCLTSPGFHLDLPLSRGGKTLLRLDGLLKAPEEFKDQKTIIKGDEKDVFIACASIVAKVTRDRLMCKLATKYPNYSFEIHKGYGTRKHLSLIREFGLSPIHRSSFCKKLQDK